MVGKKKELKTPKQRMKHETTQDSVMYSWHYGANTNQIDFVSREPELLICREQVVISRWVGFIPVADLAEGH